MLQFTPTRTKSLRNRVAVENHQATTEEVSYKHREPKNDHSMPVMKDVGTWTPSRKQQSSLEQLKSKFSAKSSVTGVTMTTTDEDVVLPWKQFQTPPDSQQQPSWPIATTKDYNNMLHELDVSHVLIAASNFKPMEFTEAEKLVKKFQHLQELIDALYGRIRIQTDTQRATATAFKLDKSCIEDFIQEICQSNQQTMLLIDEFYFTSQSAHRMEANYLQHLAGTLATAMQHQYVPPQEDMHRILTKILVKLEAIFDHYDDTTDQRNVSTIASTSSSSSSSANSSMSFLSEFTQANSIDTLPSSVYTTTTSSTSSTLHEKIDEIIEKLSRQLKQKQELLRVLELQSTTHEELARQRARSASLVLELERSRSKRELIAKKQEKDMIMLRDQLMQETMRRQSLQDRVTSLEHTLKSKETELNKLKKQPPMKQEQDHESCQLQIKQLQQELQDRVTSLEYTLESREAEISALKKQPLVKQEETHDACQLRIKQLQQELQDKEQLKEEEQEAKEKENAALQKKLSVVEQRNLQLQHTITDHRKKELVWSSQEKSVLAQCQKVLKTSFLDCEKAVQSTISYLTERYQQNGASRVPDESHLQQQLNQLQHQFEQAKRTFTTRESAFILQSASTEAELERNLKEYDRLTRNIVDFNNERKKFEDEISMLHQDKELLEKRICDNKVSSIKESSLRREFRSLMASVKDKHTKALLQELEKQRQLEQELRDIKSDIEMKRWEKVDVAVQTHYFDIAS